MIADFSNAADSRNPKIIELSREINKFYKTSKIMLLSCGKLTSDFYLTKPGAKL